MEIIRVTKWMDRPDDFTGIAIDNRGTQFYFKNGGSHREDGPAIVFTRPGNKDTYWLDDQVYHDKEYHIEMAKRNTTLGKLIFGEKTFGIED